MNIPPSIKEFLSKQIVLKNYCLPHFYPETNSFLQFQIGYKTKSTQDIKVGDFQDSWFVICSGYAKDPFFISLDEEGENFPVYFAWHGAGKWKPMLAAKNINEFANQLVLLKELEKDPKMIQDKLKKYFDLKNEFWMAVYNEYEIDDTDEI